jgi:hypothetical protein
VAVDAEGTVSRAQRSAIFGIVNASHAFNHANSSMMAVLYQPISRELGFGPFEIGVLQTTYQIASQGFQVAFVKPEPKQTSAAA